MNIGEIGLNLCLSETGAVDSLFSNVQALVIVYIYI